MKKNEMLTEYMTIIAQNLLSHHLSVKFLTVIVKGENIYKPETV